MHIFRKRDMDLQGGFLFLNRDILNSFYCALILYFRSKYKAVDFQKPETH